MALPDFTELENHLNRISADPAQIESFRARYPSLVKTFIHLFAETEEYRPNLKSCPAYADLSAIQLTVFDNWKEKKRGTRWGAAVKAYAQAPVKNWKRTEWAATALLWPVAEAVSKATALQNAKLKYPIDAATVDLVQGVVDAKSTGHVGILAFKNPKDGTFFFELHVLWIDVDGDAITDAIMISPDCSLVFPEFVKTDAGKNALTGKAVAMSRCSGLSSMDDWATGTATVN